MNQIATVFNNIAGGVSKAANITCFQLKKHSPAILVGVGLISGIACTVTACLATTKASEILGEAKTEIDDIQKVLNDPDVPAEKYSDDDAKSDRRKVYVRTGLQLAKTYAVPAGLGIVSVCSVLGATKILNNRNAAVAATLASTTLGFDKYRERLIKKFGNQGEALDKELRYGTEEVEIKEKVIGEDGKEKTVKRKVTIHNNSNEPLALDYTRVFDWSNPYWKPDMNYNLMFMRGRQTWSGLRLEANGYLFWNEVLKECGFSKVKAGQTVGWLYNPDNNDNGDNGVNFRIHEAYSYDDHGNKLPILLLDFNCDGSILNDVDWDKTAWEM